ncbi:amino acid-binding protein [Lysinibacter cavernae]|uniref:Amino acid-binding ACT domain-containing protein n=1 Tax=Lysinibacter cavernae TaxID=1640652 RepID=A0A7X5QYL6_9MICO|nr:amino acid-binding protein [Lysinibacter cavernae]NIH52395.1 hypothetical protein [Lysinibacter cavernae]
MKDIMIPGVDGAKSLASVAEILGDAGVGLEGGGLWSGTAHYLVADGDTAIRALVSAGIIGAEMRQVVIAELDRDAPGALGRMMAKLADAGIVLDGQYSDHNNRKVLLVNDIEAAQAALS